MFLPPAHRAFGGLGPKGLFMVLGETLDLRPHYQHRVKSMFKDFGAFGLPLSSSVLRCLVYML